MKYLYPKQVIYLYQQLIEQTGGTLGLRDEGLLEAAGERAIELGRVVAGNRTVQYV